MQRLWMVITLVVGVGFAGCDSAEPLQPSEPQPTSNNTTPPNPDGEKDVYNLSIVGWQHLYLDVNEKVTLQVRYTKNDVGIGNEAISFKFVGDSKAAALSAFNARTNSVGLAETVVTAGTILGRVAVEARSPKGNAVEWAVDIEKKQPQQPEYGILTGTYEITSKFDIQTHFTGTKMGDVLSLINDISNDPDDPGKFIVDQVLDNVTNEPILAVANFLRPILNAEVNKLITKSAPNMVNGLKKIASDLSAISRRFEVVSTAKVANALRANSANAFNHVLKKMAWEIDGQRAEYTFGQLGMNDPTVLNVAVDPVLPTAANDDVFEHTISEHAFDLKFGSFVLVALNEFIIPNVKPSAKNLGGLLVDYVDCDNLGTNMNNTVKLGGQGLWTAACVSAMNLLSGYVEDKILGLNDDQTTLTLRGQTTLVDKNVDGYYDMMSNGLWEGTFTLNQASASIVHPNNTFVGIRTQ